jgi:very-short-patch-repair endonuclease
VPNEIARALRKRLTPQEVKLWVRLRELKRLAHHFRRQAPVGPYVVDFICFRAQLVVEADGGQHGMSEGVRSEPQWRHGNDFKHFEYSRALR